jgi:hypothetical protein
VLLPPVALAFTEGAMAAHCLSGDHHSAAAAHVHDDGAAHHHDESGSGQKQAGADDKSAPATCCGLFCLSAAMADTTLSIGKTLEASTLVLMHDDSIAGRGPDRIERPPIVLLSL